MAFPDSRNLVPLLRHCLDALDTDAAIGKADNEIWSVAMLSRSSLSDMRHRDVSGSEPIPQNEWGGSALIDSDGRFMTANV
ncbi:MAG: hypothetical protein QM674_01605 [Burkholderiaceae bacterium]